MKLLKGFLVLSIILILTGVGLYLYNNYQKIDDSNTFFMLEVNVGKNKVTIEPKKQLAKINDKEINLTNSELNRFNDYFLDYFQEIKSNKAKEDTTYLWTIKFQDIHLNNYYLGKDEYPDDWEEFLKVLDNLLGSKYFTKKEEIKKEEDLSLKTTSNINFNDSCNAYSCSYSVKTSSRTLLLEYKKTADSNGIGRQQLILNNKELINDDFEDGGPIRLRVLEDIVIVLYQYGSSKEDRVLKCYDENGKELFVFDVIDSQYTGMYLYEDDFEIKNNYILINATRELKDNKLKINDSTAISYCNQTEKDEYEIDDSSIVRATYKMEYIDNKFTIPVMTNSITLLSSGLLSKCS